MLAGKENSKNAIVVAAVNSPNTLVQTMYK